MTRPTKKPIYTLPHGIQVIGEYAPNAHLPYWRLRIRPHPFFDSKPVCGGLYVRRSRVLMSAHLGRPLLRSEHVHHKNHDRTDDRIENFELLDAADHNRHHKTGTKHRPESKAKTAASMHRAHATGLHAKPEIVKRRPNGQIVTTRSRK
jgi:hypothetical protein